MSTASREERDLADALRQARVELAAAREQLEVLAEQQADADRARAALLELATNVNARLTKAERSPRGVRGWAKRRLIRNLPTPPEADAVAMISTSRLFDGVWYLSHYPEVARTGLSPALHYLRHGAGEGKDPGPDFSTRHYESKHPLLKRTGDNALLNHLRTGR